MEPAEKIENIDTIMCIDKEYLEVFKPLFNLNMYITYNKLSKEEKTLIRTVEDKINKLYYEVIKLEHIKFDDILGLIKVYMYLCKMYIYSNEKQILYLSKDHLLKCIELLKGKELEPKAILISINTLHTLALVSYLLEDLEKSKSLLDKAIQLHFSYINEKRECLLPIQIFPIVDNFGDQIDSKIILQKLYIETLEYLSFVHQKSSDHADKHKSIMYKHMALKCRLIDIEDITCKNDIFEYIKWAVDSALLSTSFCKYNRFTEARNHLAAASFIIKKLYIKRLYVTMDEKQKKYFLDYYQYGNAQINKYWAHYGIELLHLSKGRALPSKEDNKLCEASNSNAKSAGQSTNLLLFSDLEKDLETFSNVIPDKYLLNYNDAKAVFVNVLKWLNEAITYYSIEKYLEDHAQILHNISLAYRYFAYYEQNKEKRIKIYKRQIGILENILKILKPELNKKFYQQIHIELAISYSAILTTKSEFFEITELLSMKEKTDIKELVRSSMYNFQTYLDLSMTNEK